jgi:hypothetical protein
MRTTGFVLALLVLPVMAAAQHERPNRPGRPSAREHARPATPPPPPPSSLGPIGLPLPSIGLPLPSIGLQPLPKTQPVPGMNNGPDHPAFSPNRRPHWRPSPVYPVYAVPYYYDSYASSYVSPPPAAPAEAQYGWLRLDIRPTGQWQLFVDSIFIGAAEDLGNEVDLPAGPKRIEIRAPGYESIFFDARIEPRRTITYRASLQPIEPEPRPALPAQRDAPVAATGSRTLYVIPGCYLGNVKPEKDKLRAGCDLSGMKTITP